MPRRTVLDTEWMLRARAGAWEYNYNRRKLCAEMGENKGVQVLRVLDRFGFPAPQMELSGWLDKDASELLMGDRVRLACEAAGLPLADYELLARWYWSPDEWQVYVHAWNSLPDVSGKYTFSWEGRVMPKVVPLGAVESPVGNLGVSGGNLAVVPVSRELIERGKRRR